MFIETLVHYTYIFILIIDVQQNGHNVIIIVLIQIPVGISSPTEGMDAGGVDIELDWGVQARQLMSCGRYQGRRPPHCFSTMSSPSSDPSTSVGSSASRLSTGRGRGFLKDTLLA